MSSAPKKQSPRLLRQQKIVDHVVSNGFASAAELSNLTGVSLMTVHRDLDDLVTRGLLRKFHGGVSAQPSTVFESSSDFRLHTHTREKEALAAEGLRMVAPGMSVMIDDSTTALALARLLPDVGPLTVVSNYRQVQEALREVPDIRLIGLGGEYSRTHDSYVGLPCQEMVSSFSVDIVFLSTSAMNAQMTYHQEQEIVLVKRAMLESASTRVLMMDASKVGRAALHRFAPVSAFDHVLLAGEFDPELVEAMREHTDVRQAALT
ncbi:DeoR family transcriptional regulator [Saccharopolyspora erythraea NRRL 2338]|uniref:DeoR family transcriptional regulator of sugar metabolism n=2 Tax=Saccharopolyspora erythraea TaxID=1836 RepID=A4FK87_SACEN|nr:DeoR/GlpR family DNA-binding transcription regulator [Saccharopolyspora erythraea]EQD85255.1 DeoR family transcripitonal regulator [Saccharopolyspora erythraea D]PFG98100.1 DeoR family transcriptional regulator [Saccharopolyspora erythraea NRRL 2338]QRK88210.1 DeoR/GlpR transcriptional regulator [Saccharopolyspora erythraea]CAM04462.1 DeoR family transcriptional regulator of sugar metabolism [Saccharopolyspora erythraea NRRL 2338]